MNKPIDISAQEQRNREADNARDRAIEENAFLMETAGEGRLIPSPRLRRRQLARLAFVKIKSQRT